MALLAPLLVDFLEISSNTGPHSSAAAPITAKGIDGDIASGVSIQFDRPGAVVEIKTIVGKEYAIWHLQAEFRTFSSSRGAYRRRHIERA